MSIVLAGMPGSGKTTVSKLLAEKLKAELLDTDEIIVSRYGAISDIFAQFGEEAFRNFETEVVKEVAAKDAIISVGGGALLRKENCAAFKSARAKIVFLRAQYETLLSRLQGDNTRPLLQGDTGARLKKLLEERTPLYEAVADITIDTDGIAPEVVAEKIAELAI